MSSESDAPSLHYDRITNAWSLLLGEDLHYGYFEPPTDNLAQATQRLTDKMASAAALSSENHVLDVGCGTGHPARFLATTFGCRVTGLSTSDVGLSLARRRIAATRLTPLLSFENRDATDNGFPDSNFDRVWVMESSHLMPRKDRLMSECTRVLSSGGRLVLCDIMLYRELSISDVVLNARSFDVLRKVYGRAVMATPEFYTKAAETHGLRVEESQNISVQTRPTFASWRRNAFHHRDQVERLAGAVYWKSFIESCDILEEFWDKAVLGYWLIVARKK